MTARQPPVAPGPVRASAVCACSEGKRQAVKGRQSSKQVAVVDLADQMGTPVVPTIENSGASLVGSLQPRAHETRPHPGHIRTSRKRYGTTATSGAEARDQALRTSKQAPAVCLA